MSEERYLLYCQMANWCFFHGTWAVEQLGSWAGPTIVTSNRQLILRAGGSGEGVGSDDHDEYGDYGEGRMIFFSSWNPLHVPRHKVTRQVQLPNHDVCKIAKKIEEERVQNCKRDFSEKS